MIEKPTIIVTSLGRTATQFFGNLFRTIIPDSTVLHEPDIFHWEPDYGLQDILRQTKEMGISNFLIRKPLGKWMILQVSHKRFKREISYAEATKQLLEHRRNYVKSKPGTIYAETGSGYYGLIDVIPSVYKTARVIYIVRDGRDWIRSRINFGSVYNRNKIKALTNNPWPGASDIQDNPYSVTWLNLTDFQKLCWAWVNLNSYALKSIQNNPNAMFFRFEDIFKAPNRYENLQTLVDFATTFQNNGMLKTKPIDGLLEKQVHQSSGSFPKWPDWEHSKKMYFEMMCGDLMRNLGYDIQ